MNDQGSVLRKPNRKYRIKRKYLVVHHRTAVQRKEDGNCLAFF